MKCPKCKTPLRKGSKFCPKCGAKVKHTARNIFQIVLAVALLLGGAGVASWKLGLFQPMSSDNDENFVLLSGTFTDRLIVDQASALAAIGDVADILGIEDVNAEFSECKVDTVSGNTYYRFYQEYEGIPVYGRSVIVAADKNGDGLSLSGNYFDVGGISTFPRTDEASAIEAAREYYGEDATIISEGLVIYSLQDHAPESAWELYIASDNTLEYCFVSAASGNVLAQNSLVYTETAIGYGEDIDGEKKTFNTKVEDDKFFLEDEDRSIFVYNANNGTLVYQRLVVDDKGNTYSYDNDRETWVDKANNAVKVRYYDNNVYGDFTVYDAQEKVVGQHAYYAFKLTTKNIFTDIYAVTNDSAYWSDKKAVTAMSRVKDVFDFYQQVLGRNGFNNLNSETLVVYNDYKGGDTTNAYSTSLYSNVATLLAFASDNSLSYDTFGHEYTHSVESSISGMIYSGESGALMEAYSDIFGELVEDWAIDHTLDGNCDWIHNPNGSLPRNIINPSLSTQSDGKPYPMRFQGENWRDTSASADYGGVHSNNTVVSHAAYLMNTGIGGNPNYQALSTEDLAHLFYETLYTLPSDCTFSQFRTLVENTADIMCQQGALTEKQRLCVSNAFFQVGIAPTTTPVAKELTLDIYGVDGLPYEDYTLYVRHYSGAEKTYTSETITKEGISFPTIGSYELCIVDNVNTDNQTSITVKVVDHGGAAELPVFTQCGLSKIDGPIIAPSSDNSTPLEAYMEAANRTTTTGSWTEDMNMTASMVLKNGSSTTKAKATMEASVDIEGWNGTDTSSLYMSGSASMSVLNQTIAYTMTWQNGMAHYEYTEPTVTSADLKIDPSYFNFNSLTDDMIISSAMNGNQITFSIQGDALTKAGISAVNSLLSGVENLSYEDAAVNVTVNEQSGKIDALTMTFRASMTYQGYDAEADYEIQYEFSEHEGAEKSEDVTNSNQDLSDLQARFFVKDVDSGLNLRSLPQHDSNLEGTIYDDTIMYFYGEIGQGLGSDGVMHEWYKVMADQELIGWVRSDLIKEIFIESEPEKPTSYLEDLSYDAWDRYTGNEGDSFIEKLYKNLDYLFRSS